MKAGDGVTAWSGLVYVAGDGGGGGGAVTSVNGKVGIVQLDKGDIGLGVVDNTSDADKPVSTATQTALDDKAPLTATESLNGRVTTNEGNISDNAGNIATNTTGISTNAGNIATNTW